MINSESKNKKNKKNSTGKHTSKRIFFRRRALASHFHSFVQIHSMDMFSVVCKYSRNTLEIFWK